MKEENDDFSGMFGGIALVFFIYAIGCIIWIARY
jgi:hypothetical protein